VYNNGPSIATDVVIMDILDPRLIYLGSNEGGVYNSATRTVTWNISTIGINETITLIINVTINGTGNISNMANVTVTQENEGENNTNDVNLTIPETVNLTISKSVNVTGSVKCR